MLRAMMLTLTLILVTMTAAYLGRDEQLTQVLRQTKTPVTSTSSSAAPPVSSSAPQSSSSAESRSPRFVMDEPLSNPVPGEDGFSDDGHSSQPSDPSAHAQVSPGADEDKEYKLPAPTEEQKLAAAEPYVKELFELKERSIRQLKELANEALTEYLSTTPDRRSAGLPQMIDKYLPRVQQLESQTDDEAEAILLKMTAALSAIGADDSIAQEARSAYEHSKQEQISHYTELFSSLPS